MLCERTFMVGYSLNIDLGHNMRECEVLSVTEQSLFRPKQVQLMGNEWPKEPYPNPLSYPCTDLKMNHSTGTPTQN